MAKSARRARIKTPPVLFAKTQAALARIQKHVDGAFLSYWISPGGSVCDNDVMALHEVLEATGSQRHITLFVKSDGGSAMASLRMIHLLRKYTRRLTVLAPLNCASAATMLALGADEIAMGPLSYLTAVDTSLEHELSPVDHTNHLVAVSNDEVDRVIRLWKDTVNVRRSDNVNPYQELYKYLHPLVIGALDRASSLSLMLCREILAYHMKDARKADRISRRLNSSYPAHQYPITSREARKLGLKINDIEPGLDRLLLELNLLYSEMGQRAITDFDEENHHDNEITNILESKGLQVFYQVEKDWHYRKEERRWVSMNDSSCWYRCHPKAGRVAKEKFHIR
jgi:Serine dehydrogenase proteinase